MAFIKILLSENRVFTREEIKDSFYNEYEIGKSLGHAGKLLTNVSQYLTNKDNYHLRQVIDFEMEEERQGAPKDNFYIISDYRDLLIAVINNLDSQSNQDK